MEVISVKKKKKGKAGNDKWLNLMHFTVILYPSKLIRIIFIIAYLPFLKARLFLMLIFIHTTQLLSVDA